MGKHDEEYDFLEDAFRDEPKASTPAHAGDEKAAIIVAIIAALVLLVLLGVESMNALGAFLSVASTN